MIVINVYVNALSWIFRFSIRGLFMCNVGTLRQQGALHHNVRMSPSPLFRYESVFVIKVLQKSIRYHQ